MKEEIYNIVKNIMGNAVPEYVWYPILRAESQGNPEALNINSREYSVGLFQINRKAHPEYTLEQLLDPTTNATIARDVFLLPKYNQIKGSVTDPLQQTITVYKEGIRPKWTDQTKDRITGYYNDFITQGSGVTPGTGAGSGTGTGGSVLIPDKLTFTQGIVKIVFIVIMVIFLFYIILRLFDVNMFDLSGSAVTKILSAAGKGKTNAE